MNLEELETIANEKHEIEKTKHAALIDHLRSAMAEFITNNLNGIAKIQCVNEGCMQLEIPRNDMKYGHTLDIYYHAPFGKDNRRLELNFGCFGSFNCDDINAINYCIALGKIASHMKELEQKLILSDKAKKLFDEYVEARNAYYRANDEARNFINEQKKIEDDKKRNEIAAKIVVGAKIEAGKLWNGNPKIVEIEHITPKNVIFKYGYGTRTKKDILINSIFHGEWKFVD